MPCYTYESPKDIRDDYYRSFTHNSPVAEMLCTMCKLSEEHGWSVPSSVAPWWAEHKKRDARKAKEESKAKGARLDRERALAKLTKAERKLLGL